MGIVNNMLAGASGNQSYNLTKSLRFRSSASAYLSRNQLSGNSQTFTWSAWVKRGKLGVSQDLFGTIQYPTPSNYQSYFAFNSDDTFHVELYSGAAYFGQLYTTQVFRDPSAWYHIVVAFDTTQATAANRIKLYINGSQVTAFGTASYPSQNATTYINNTASSGIGIGRVYPYNDSNYFDGYFAEMYFVDGQQLTASSFGSTNASTGVWQPKKYVGTYGTNGFYLPFTNTTSTATLGNDFSGNNNTWTVNNISLTAGTTYDSMTDVPTLTSPTAANFAVCNPLNTHAVITTSGANLNTTYAAGAYQAYGTGTTGITSGKLYWEVTVNTVGATGVGIFQAAGQVLGTEGTNNTFNSASSYIYFYDGKKYNGSATGVAYGAAYTTGDVIGVAFDAGAGTLTFYKNNVSQGTAYTGLTATPYLPSFCCYSGSNLSFNFGQRPFTYTPPTGYVALNTFNLPTSTIVAGNKVMDATIYTGTGSAASITNAAGFNPDMVWLKCRSNATNHYLTDSVRGTTKQIYSNSTAAEGTSGNVLTAFNSNGFSLGTDAEINGSTRTYVGWQWQAGQGSTSSNTNGSITSTVSVNATAGFSVVGWTGNGTNGATVGHGLGVAPNMIIIKNRVNTGGYNWLVYHSSISGGIAVSSTTFTTQSANFVYLNLTNASGAYIFDGQINGSGNTMISYCWAAIPGFSAFGSYTGNGSTDGPFIYTGFRPRFILLKDTTSASDWAIYDTARNPYNVSATALYPDTTAAEDSIRFIDILSNGFKQRIGSATNYNVSGDTYIYAAFAENPFKYALAR